MIKKRIRKSEANHRRELYHALRRAMVEAMGGSCQECRATTQLEFHHTRARTWVTRQKNRLQRMRLYRDDYEAGHLILLCRSCNAAAGSPESMPDDRPF